MQMDHTSEQSEALARLKSAEDDLIALGYCVFRQVAQYSGVDAFFHTRISVPEPLADLIDHAFADAVRDLAVEWSNARHSCMLGWDPR
jgi:hypothetical protein